VRPRFRLCVDGGKIAVASGFRKLSHCRVA
jgi:hypothetical protein